MFVINKFFDIDWKKEILLVNCLSCFVDGFCGVMIIYLNNN